MPTLNWIGKDKVVNHHQDVPFRVLEHKYGYRDGVQSEEETGSGNMILHGDNLLALKALLPKYQGKVNCIYIDPPYNTGNEKWVYNDNVNDPRIKKWLGEVVGTEGEDLSRHDKWLCMMYPRLVLLSKLLSEKGVIFISIDDNEQATLKLVCDEIFGISNFIGQIILKTATDNNRSQINIEHEYMLCYAKQKNLQDVWVRQGEATNRIIEQYNALKKQYSEVDVIQKNLRLWIKEHKDELPQVAHYNNVDSRGVYSSSGNSSNPHPGGYMYDILHPITGKACPKPANGWRWPEATFKSYVEADEVEWGKDDTTQPHIKKRIETCLEHLRTLIYEDNRATTKQLLDIFDGKKVFDNPKPVNVISRILDYVTDKDSIILDSFAGSGTTAHAVLNLNKKDEGQRKFILIEMDDYADTVTAERVRRIIKGYGEGDKAVEGTGGAFDYYELGKPLFKDDGNLNEEVGEGKIREYIYFSETQQNLPKRNPEKKYLMGRTFNASYYFYYEPDKTTTLSNETLRQIVNEKAEQYIIYADICTLTEEEMAKYSVIFKKIPRDIKHF